VCAGVPIARYGNRIINMNNRVKAMKCRIITAAIISLSLLSAPAQQPAPAEHPTTREWKNSLGMKFVPVPQTTVLFSIWDTRVFDFAAFVRTTHHRTKEILSVGKNGWKRRGATWKAPGFKQGPTYPVVGITWDDAKAFCDWLTVTERRKGIIGENQCYRLPKDNEWSRAAGCGKFSYGGNTWPPPEGAGNYAGEESRLGNEPRYWGVITGYRDNYPRTSPVGSFPPNRYGLYDMGGNVWQMCEDFYRKSMNGWFFWNSGGFIIKDDGGKTFHVKRGGSWVSADKTFSKTSFRNSAPLFRGDDFTGFRCVLASQSHDRQSVHAEQ